MWRSKSAALTMLLAALLASSYPLSTYSDPAYGLLRTFGDKLGGQNFRAYDIEVDEEGIYIVGVASSARREKAAGGWTPFLLALKRDHTLKCNLMFGFLPPGQGVPDGVAVETNETHAIVAGYFMLAETITNLFVAAFSKGDLSGWESRASFRGRFHTVQQTQGQFHTLFTAVPVVSLFSAAPTARARLMT